MYLGADVSKTGGTDDDIKARLGKEREAYNEFCKISQFTIKTKTTIFKTNIISVLFVRDMEKDSRNGALCFMPCLCRPFMKEYFNSTNSSDHYFVFLVKAFTCRNVGSPVPICLSTNDD